MLRNKWTYLCDELYPALPNLQTREEGSKMTFDILDEQIKDIDKQFLEHFKFRRDEPDDVDKFKQGRIEYFSRLQKRVLDLSAYVGLMKLAFYQRTVSVEVPCVTAGYTRSPERTAGNELIYVAADNVAHAYMSCLDTPKAYSTKLPMWDGFITYVPPITDELSLGAFCEVTPYGLVRLSLSERHKPTISNYLLLAHEIGHIPVFGLKPGQTERPRYRRLAESLIKEVRNVKRIKGRTRDCARDARAECRFHPIDVEENSDSVWVPTLVQIFADIFGTKIGGPTTIEVLLNETLLSKQMKEFPRYVLKSILLRLWGSVQYMSLSPFTDNQSKVIKERLCLLASQYDKEEDLPYPCFRCMEQIGKKIGKRIKETERKNTSLFSSFIKKGKAFRIGKREESEIMRILMDGHLCTDTDPRKILHCYFLASQETSMFRTTSRNRASFGSTLHSLAYNRLFIRDRERHQNGLI